MRMVLSSTLALLIGTGTALAFPTEEVPTAEPAYLAKVKTAAPAEIVAKASIVMMQDGKSRSLQTGTNGYTCLISPDGTPLCADENGMAWWKAVGSKSDPAKQDRFHLYAGCWLGIPEPATTTRISARRINIGCRPALM